MHARNRLPTAVSPKARQDERPPNVRPYRAIACDADGTLTWRHRLNIRTAATLVRWREAGGHVILVMGEIRDDLLHFARTALFDRIVGENGGVLLRPPDWMAHPLGPAPPAEVVRRLRGRVDHLSVGRVLLSTRVTNEDTLRHAVGPCYQLVRNGKDVMALPVGITKETGVAVAAKDLGLTCDELIGVGNGENDGCLVRGCGLGVAVANAVPKVKRVADWVTKGRGPDGIVELIRRLLVHDVPRVRHRKG